MERMSRSAARASLPDWVPHSDSASLYIRPTFIGTEPSLGVSRPGHALLYVILSPVGAYFASGPMGAVGLLAEPRYVRAWVGGVGDYKMGGNYAPTILVQDEAGRVGCQQALWLYGDDHQITEVGTMNIFLFWTDPQGDLELVTPPLNGIILPGVTRQSLLDLGRKWAAPLHNSSPLYQFDGQVRLRHLYTANAHTQLFLEITPQGEVRGAPDQTPYKLHLSAHTPAAFAVVGGVGLELGDISQGSAWHSCGKRWMDLE
ncbi:glycerol uptake facilitator protein [Platysternon megacephalum]|uniref:Branched-chain-amino-acid aminotransferase n=1 Tax=Platysternon megacephalum TaxID=55544 RepID=A0A4D9DGB5_9SAUR|nr:glycerol uptake facilitator protein [Platysternon megacephalum]